MFDLLAARPAGGATLDQVAIASSTALFVTAVLLWLGLGHRSGRVQVLARVGGFGRRVSGLPEWAAIPAGIIVVSLITALFGMLWDISLHIAQGRDEGPLANVAHYFILAGLFGVFASGFLSMCLPLEKPSKVAVRIARGWYAPLGGVLITACGTFSLIGFPLDDVWHRLFGQDVTLWGPTHLMLITGAGLSIVGLLILEMEGHGGRSNGGLGAGRVGRFVRQGSAMGGLLLGLSVFQGEYDFDVPQFRLVLEPFMIAGAAGLALVAARLWMGRGGALMAAAFFLVIRGAIALIVGGALDEITPSFPLYLGSAVLVELLALAWPPARRPLLFGAVAGALIGTVGTATEWGWTHLVQTLSWNSDVLVEGTLMAVVAGVAGGLLGALLALGLRGRLPRPAVARTVLLACLVALAAGVTNGLIATVPDDVEATFTITDVDTDPRTADITVQLSPAGAVDDPAWVQITSWQGQGLVVDDLERIGPGEYRTTEPVPLHGTWKTLLRVHDGRQLYAVPIYLPADEAIPADEIPADDGVTRGAIPEIEVLQRELKDSGGGLWALSNLVVLACTLALIGGIGWGVGRYSRRGSAGERFPDTPVEGPVSSAAGTR